MKKIFLIIATVILLFSCGQTKNEDELIDMFIGNGENNTPRIRPENYGDMQPTQNVYLQNFDNAATSEWVEKNDGYSMQGYENGELVIQGKQNYHTWQNFSNLNQSLDFQMEIRAQFNFVAVTSVDAYLGIVYGVDSNKNSFYYIALFNNDKMQIGYCNGSAYDNWYIQPSNLTKNAHHVYTIRKAGNQMYFFADKNFVYKTTYSQFLPNYGFWLSTGGIVSADYARIDYIE